MNIGTSYSRPKPITIPSIVIILRILGDIFCRHNSGYHSTFISISLELYDIQRQNERINGTYYILKSVANCDMKNESI